MENETNQKKKACRIKGNREIATGVHLLTFERPGIFLAGQMVWLSLEENGPARLYSIFSGERDHDMEVLFDVKPQGQLTPRLAGVKAGGFVFSSQPFGSFTGTRGPEVWIAAGTGIAPFVSRIRSGNSFPKHMIHGGRDLLSFYGSEWFNGKEEYIRCSSRTESEGIYWGRVTDFLLKEYKPLGCPHLICGSAEFVVDVRDVLISQGLGYDLIVSEIYF